MVLGAIGLVFVFWGINWTLSAPNYAAKVNGSEIPATTCGRPISSSSPRPNGRPTARSSDAQRSEIKRRVLDEFVNSEAVVTRAD